KLAEITQGYSGADIAGLCREAATAAVRDDWKAKPVKMQHFEEAMNEIRASISEDDMKGFEATVDRMLRRQPGKSDILPGYV
ncbi:MAG: hypothetical protein EAX95_16105, partial [Candidatus Thorarchaeota archaeon]|nr:hypothetical protein [Candidatus Thorarchaeota archaeon]